MQLIDQAIRKARQRANLTQPELAVAAGLGLGTIRRIETGFLDGLQLHNLLRLAKGLGVPLTIKLGNISLVAR